MGQRRTDIQLTISKVPEVRTRRIAELNDAIRRRDGSDYGTWHVSDGIVNLDTAEILQVFRLLREFNQFDGPNDPHDHGAFDFNGQEIIWKIDYLTRDRQQISLDPSNPTVTHRILTLMLAKESGLLEQVAPELLNIALSSKGHPRTALDGRAGIPQSPTTTQRK